MPGDEMCPLHRHGENKQHIRNYIHEYKFHNGPSKALLFRRENRKDDPSTEMLNEIGTTDQVIGEPLIEEILTTPGKIPNEMYELGNTSPGPEATFFFERSAPAVTEHTPSASTGIVDINEPSIAKPSILFIIGVILGILLLFGCIIACAISRMKKKNYNKRLNKEDVECNEADRPLLGTCTRKDSSTSTCRRN